MSVILRYFKFNLKCKFVSGMYEFEKRKIEFEKMRRDRWKRRKTMVLRLIPKLNPELKQKSHARRAQKPLLRALKLASSEPYAIDKNSSIFRMF